jgi:hypothetical protein
MWFALLEGMQTTMDHGTAPAIPRNPLATSDVATQAQSRRVARAVTFGIGALVTPIAAGAAVAALTRSRRLGWLSGGASALLFGLARWQFQRWFTDEPAYILERAVGDLEIRRYLPRVEAHTRFSTLEFDEVRERGFRRLASYIFGANSQERELEMTCPVTIAPRTRSHTVAFVMPPGISLGDLPQPDDSRILVVEVPARRVAVLRYHGGYNAKTVARHAAELREQVAAAGLTTLGEPMFAGFDPPTTLPFLRRSEIWIELA